MIAVYCNKLTWYLLGSGQSSNLIQYISTFNGCETMLYNYERITKMYIGLTKRIEIGLMSQ